MRSSIQSAKTRLGADCGSDHELLFAKFRLKKLKKIDHSNMTETNSLMIIQWKVTNRFKGLDLIDRRRT